LAGEKRETVMTKKPEIKHEYHAKKDKLEITIHGYPKTIRGYHLDKWADCFGHSHLLNITTEWKSRAR
jgi:hypothetical protein